jgi:hypothetical protein
MVKSRQQATINVAYAIKTRPCVKLRDTTLISQASLVTFDTVTTGPSFAVLVVGVALIRSPLSFRQSSFQAHPSPCWTQHRKHIPRPPPPLLRLPPRPPQPRSSVVASASRTSPHNTHLYRLSYEVSACYNRDLPQQHSNGLLSLVVRPALSRSYFS